MEKIKLNNESLYERFDSAAVQDKKLNDTLGQVKSTFSDKLDYQKKEIESKIEAVESKIQEANGKMEKKFEEKINGVESKIEEMNKSNSAMFNKVLTVLEEMREPDVFWTCWSNDSFKTEIYLPELANDS